MARLREELGRRHGTLLENVFLEEKALLAERALLKLARSPGVIKILPGVSAYEDEYLRAREGGTAEEREAALAELYSYLHRAGSGYTPPERELLDSKMGITCQPGGIIPLIMAEPFIGPETAVADLGAGNGLQGLLLQRLAPHRRTMQIELSSGMVEAGRVFQEALDIPEDRVEWFNSDIMEAPFERADFIYIYRPARPTAGGNALYRAVAERLASSKRPGVVMSVADCLGRFLEEGFPVFYEGDGITVFARRLPMPAVSPARRPPGP
jgi:SAM-dependent methyltransferase